MMSVVIAQSGTLLADHLHALHVAVAVVGAAHRLQDAAGARLQRQVDVLAQARQLGMRGDQPLAHVLGMRARVADALDALAPRRRGPAASAKSMRSSLRQVAPVGVHVLAEQRHLLDAVGGQRLDLARRCRPARGSPRARASTARCSRSRRSCSRRRSAPTPGTGARASSAGRRGSPRTRSSPAPSGRRTGGTRRACRSGPGRTRRPRTGTARRPGPSATATSSRPRPTTRFGSSDFSRLASPRLPISRLSADSRIEHVLKRIRSAPSRSAASS